MRSKRDSSAAGSAMFSVGLRLVSYLPQAGLAAASTVVRVFRVVVMPALAMLTVCCSMTCRGAGQDLLVMLCMEDYLVVGRPIRFYMFLSAQGGHLAASTQHLDDTSQRMRVLHGCHRVVQSVPCVCMAACMTLQMDVRWVLCSGQPAGVIARCIASDLSPLGPTVWLRGRGQSFEVSHQA